MFISRHFLYFIFLGLFWGISQSLYKAMALQDMPISHVIVYAGFGVGAGLVVVARLSGTRLDFSTPEEPNSDMITNHVMARALKKNLDTVGVVLQEAKVAVSPGIGFGEHGDGHVRFALVENQQRTRQALRNIKSFLGRYHNVIERSEQKVSAAE